jgi:protein TonB
LVRAGQDAQRVVPQAPRVVERPKPAAEAIIPRVKQGGVVQPPRLIRRVDPPYPPLAKAAGVQGVVRMSGVISADGRIIELTVDSGNPLLVPAARAAVLQWRYAPTLLNGDPVEVETTIVVTFTLSQ